MIRADNLTGKPAVQTDLQLTNLAVTSTRDLATSAPKKPKKSTLIEAKLEPANRRQPATSSTSTLRQPPPSRQPEKPLRQTTPPLTATIPAPPTATLTFSRQEKTATPAPKPTATVQPPAPKPAPAEKRPAPSPETEDARPRQQQRLSNCDCHQRPASDVHRSHHYWRREVRNICLRQLRHSTTGSRKTISIAREIWLQEHLLDRTTRRWGTNRHRHSLTETTTRRDPPRRSSSLLSPCHKLRVDSLQRTDDQVPPRDLVDS